MQSNPNHKSHPADDTDDTANKAAALTQIKSLLGRAGAFFEDALAKNSSAQEYLVKRGLSEQTIRDFEVGFAPDSWQDLAVTISDNSKDAATQAGLLVKSEKNGRHYDFFRNRVIFPIKNTNHEIIGFGGRVLNSSDSPKYLNTPETPAFSKGHELFNLNRLLSDKVTHAIVVEGYMDVVAAHNVGIKNCVASLGTAFTNQHAQLLVNGGIQSVKFAFDGDRAGYNAAVRTLPAACNLRALGVQVGFAFMPANLDPDDVIQRGGAAELLRIFNKNTSPEMLLVHHHCSGLRDKPSIDLSLQASASLFKDASQLKMNTEKLSDVIENYPFGSEYCRKILLAQLEKSGDGRPANRYANENPDFSPT